MLGADEASSSILFGRIRELATDLAREKNRYSDALRVVRLAREVFAELPDATAKLEDDIAALESIEEDLAIEKVVSPLFMAVEAAKADIPGTIRALGRRGFFPAADSPVGEIARTYQAILEGTHPERILALAVGLVRQLAITLNNDHDDPDGSFKIISQLRAGGSLPPAMATILEGDQRALDRDAASRRFQMAMREGNLQQARIACERMIELSDGDDKAPLLRLRQELEARISKGRTKAFLGWGAAAVFVIYLVASEPKTDIYDEAAAEAAADYDAMPEDYSDAGSGFDPSAANDDVDRAIDAVMSETPPPRYGSEALNKAQLRYCLKQSERISAARDFAYTATQQGRFNAAVDDYNERCGQFRYSVSDKADVDAEILLERSRLSEQGRALLGPGNVAAAPVAAEPSASSADSILSRPAQPRSAEEAPNSMDQLMRDLEEDANRE